ncbi:MAG: hypothetical protein VX154_00780 [Pseudomonadota bacterium]|jgi:hypothetical protein|nr:hypothetical protein [Pseudomonadota bacterium]
MEHDNTFDMELETHNSEATLESMFECCNQLREIGRSSDDSYMDDVQAILEEHDELGYGVFVVGGHDDLADAIEDDDKASQLLQSALQRRKDEGIDIQATHAIISSCGNVLIINANDLSQCTLVRHVG